jgi:DDE superfamily endonuclease
MWCIPKAGAEFVACMEDVLDLYELPYDPNVPLVCFDETPKQLISEKRLPLPPRPGQIERYDYEYQRNGVRNLFMFFEPLASRRHVPIRPRRTKQDFAQVMKWLVDEIYPQAERILVVLDNLNTHKRASFYETFSPEEANRLCKKLEFHYTPKHGSWLNMAEIELSVFGRSCLSKRIPDDQALNTNVRALVEERNGKKASVNWQFRTENARIKLKHLYPSYSG